ncbi:MAG: TonB-dependent receptor [Bacteroidaceae bacterium]|nr:TonB-dependent receptor [Bacteroidaceae bacterium]
MCVAVRAQTIEVSGMVKDLQQKPVPDVIVKVTTGQTTLAFATTNRQGVYALSFDPSKAKNGATLTFSHISYEKEEVSLTGDKRKRTEDMILIPKAVTLKEVTLKADPLRLKGDTLSYNLASFLGKGDVTLEDGLKRLPGLSVADDGAISYMGKGISNFYIEGLDMLGGRYNLATKNIPAEYATTVEVMQRHQARKIDQDEESDAVALNVKLSKKAKFKPLGQPVAGLGIREKSLIGAVGLTGMMFTDKFQLLGSAKWSNHGNFGSYDMIDYHGNSSVSSLATGKLDAWDGGEAPLGDYSYQTNGYGTLNGMQKVDSTRQIRVNADYTYEERHNSFETQTLYFANGQKVGIGEKSRPWTRIHRPMLELRYENNATRHYLMDVLRLQAQFEENKCPVSSTEGAEGTALTENGQLREAKVLKIGNSMWNTARTGRHKLTFTSDISFTRAPTVCLTFDSPSLSGGGAVQSGRSMSLNTEHGTSFNIRLGKKWRIALPVRLAANYNMIETSLTSSPLSNGTLAEARTVGGSTTQQRVGGWNITPSVSPSTEWRSANQKAYISGAVVLRWLNLSYLSKYDDKRTTLSELFAEPRASFRYTFSGTSELNFSSGYNHSAGDILDLLAVPVRSSYRSTSAASGVIGKSQQWNSKLGYKFQHPFRYFSLDANAAWTQGKRNVLASQTVSGKSVLNSNIFHDCHFQSASGSFSLSKNILPITTKLTFSAGGDWGSSESMSQNVFVTTYTTGYNGELRAVVTPVTWTELTLSGNYSQHFTRYQGQHDNYNDLRAHASVAVYPIERLELRANYDFVRSQYTANEHKNAHLLSASAQLKLKRMVWRLSLNNLLNTRHYTYTVFSATDRYTFDSHLIGRTVILTCQLNLAK